MIWGSIYQLIGECERIWKESCRVNQGANVKQSSDIYTKTLQMWSSMDTLQYAGTVSSSMENAMHDLIIIFLWKVNDVK
jgi:hypothetical protein